MKKPLIALASVLVLAAAPALAQTAPDVLGRIKAAGAINVAFAGDSLPFSFVGPGNKPAGYSIDLCEKVIAAIGRAAGVADLKINWKLATTAERLALVGTNRADLECGNTTATLGRMRDVDFSSLIFVDSSGLMVKSGSPVAKLGDLAGKRVAVIAGTTTEQRLEAALKRGGTAAELVRVREAGEAVALLESGGADAVASDKIKLVGMAALAQNPKSLAMLPDDLSFEPYAFALPRGDSALRLAVNRELARIYRSGEIEGIFSKWLGMLGRPSGLLAAMYVLNATPE